MEQLELTTPQSGPSVTTYTRLRVTLDTSPTCIDWAVWDNAGGTVSGSYNGSTAAALLNQINTGNCTVTSLYKKVMQRLQADGYLGAGTISGTPV